MTDIKSSMNADRDHRVSSEEKDHSFRWIVITCLVALPLKGCLPFQRSRRLREVQKLSKDRKAAEKYGMELRHLLG